MDNRYYKYGCPALMHDGRFLTNYVRSRVVDQYIRNIYDIDSIQNFKLFLQNNGDELLNNERAEQAKIYTCNVSGKCVPCCNKSEKYVENLPKCNLKLPSNINKNSCGC